MSVLNFAGSEGDEPAWRSCVSDTNTFMGFAVGAMFVKSVFKVDSKPHAEAMIEQVRKAFEENLPNIKWMDAETRQLAREKVGGNASETWLIDSR